MKLNELSDELYHAEGQFRANTDTPAAFERLQHVKEQRDK